MSFVTSTQLEMIESTCLAQSFPWRYDDVKINDRHDDFRKKQDTMNLYVMNNDDESSKNSVNDTAFSSFPSLK